jgi:hypothetical protein
MNLLNRLFALLPRRKPNPTCGLMLLWSLPPDRAKILVDYLDAMIDDSGPGPGPGPGEDTPAQGGNRQGRAGDYCLKIPDWL